MANILLQNYNYVGPVPREGRVAKGDPKALSLSQCFSNANVHKNYLRNLVRIQILIQKVRDEARDSTFLTSSQVRLMLLGCGPRIEEQGLG